MAVTFPTSPTNGQTFTANGLSYVYNATYGVWRLNVSAGGSSGGGGVTTYATVAELPLTNNTNGDMAFVEETDRLYLSNDNGWFNIALINTSPTITNGGTGSYVLATDGTPTVITLTATDPEEVPLTWSYTVTSGALGTTATVSQADNVFTITPGTTDPDDAGTFEITFSVTDGTNIVNDVNTFTLAFATTIDGSESVIALITTNGTTGNNTLSGAIDSSPSSSSLTNTNVQFQTYSPYRSGGYSAHFNGTDAALTVPAATGLQFETGDFTVEAWIYTDHSDFFGIWQNSPIQSSATSNYYFMGVGTDGSVQFYQHSGGPGFLTSAGQVLANEWTHIAFTRYNGTCYIYVNGVEQANSGVWDGYNFNLSSDNTIGYRVTPNYASGYITDLRIVKGTAVYTTAFTPPIEPLTAITGTELLACQLPYWGDSSTNNHSIIPSGSPNTSPFTLWEKDDYDPALHGGSMRFNGSQYLQGSPNTAFGTGDFTVECWVTLDSSIIAGTTDYEGIWQISPTSGGFSTSIAQTIALWWNNQNTPEQWAIYGGGYATVNTGGFAASPDTWYHTAYVRNSGTSYIYINGKQIHSQADTYDNDSSYIVIGGAYTNGIYTWNGLISDFRVTDSAVYTSEFTPPSEPLSSTNATLHVKGTGANIIDKSQTNTLTLVGNTTASTTRAKYTTSSIYMDGTGYVELPAGSINISGSQDYTIEGWINFNSIGGDQGIFHVNWPGNNLELIMAYWNGWTTYINGSLAQDTSVTPTTNQWYHIAVSRESGTVRVFLDGNIIRTVNSDTTAMENMGLVIGGYVSTSYLSDAYFEDWRVTTGLARYTANFTPPTASLDG